MKQDQFIWSEHREPHYERRLKILKDYPEVRQLFKTDSSIVWKSILILILHLSVPLFLLPLVSHNWLWFILIVLVIGTTLNHILVLAIHEITHDLAFKKKQWNNWLAIVVNFPLFFPFSMAFKAYHAEHHWYQGKEGIDTDIASKYEALIFKGFLGKFIWLILQIPFYAIRPLLIRPLKPDTWQIKNALIQFLFLIIFYQFVGYMGLLYLFLSLILASGLHPLSGHFVSEHYVSKEGQETYSYYGWLNRLVFNVGYHNEHHDFPNIPGSKLPELKKVANKYYEDLESYNSWIQVIINFLISDRITLFSRVKRNS